MVALAAIDVVLLLYLGRHLSFYQDEWYFIVFRRGWDPLFFLLPNNEHPAMLFLAIYEPLLATFGLKSYVPFLAVLDVMHSAATLLLFLLIRRRSGDVPALVCSAIVLFLGNGADDLFWAMQIAFVGSVICGLLAMLILDSFDQPRSHLAAAGAALLGTLMFSSIGVFFCVAVGLDLILDPVRRRLLTVLFIPLAVYGVWFLLFGIHGVGAFGSPLTAHRVIGLPGYVAFGIGASLAAVVGLPPQYAPAVLPMGVMGLALHWSSRKALDRRHISLISGVIAFFIAGGLVRGQFGAQQAGSSRYVYVAAFFLLPVIAEGLAVVPWRGLWRPALVTGVAIVIGMNLLWLHRLQVVWDRKVAFQNAELATAAAFRNSPDIDLDANIDPTLFPGITPRGYFAATDSLGSPVTAYTVDKLTRLPSAPVDLTLTRLFARAVQIKPVEDPSAAADCVANAQKTLAIVAQGRELWVVSIQGGTAHLYLWYSGTAPTGPMRDLRLLPAEPVRITLPDIGPDARWKVRIEGALVCQIQSVSTT